MSLIPTGRRCLFQLIKRSYMTAESSSLSSSGILANHQEAKAKSVAKMNFVSEMNFKLTL